MDQSKKGSNSMRVPSFEKRVFICFILVLAYFGFSHYAKSETKNYDAIVKRNAFTLLAETPKEVKVENYVETSPVKLNLTGIMRYRGKTNVYLYSKDLPQRFITLDTKRNRSNSNITLVDVSQGMVTVINNGVTELLSFDTHKLPTVVTKTVGQAGPTIVKKDDRGRDDRKKEEKKEAKKSEPRPSVVKVPSRNRGITDPRMQSMMERGLEYLNKMDDSEKKEQIMKRLESLQSGQYKLKTDIDQNERRRQYDEWRKRRSGSK